MTDRLRIKIFADGADVVGIRRMAAEPMISGFTTNPTLMRKAGILDYEAFAREVLADVRTVPISFEVFSDDLPEMMRQARKIASWADNVFVKIPACNTRGESTVSIAAELAREGVKLNVTAMTTSAHVAAFAPAVANGPSAILSVFAGRIADSGRNPVPVMEECLSIIDDQPGLELLWASPREILNLVQANDIGCHIITMTHDLIAKIPILGKNLDEFALETVQMFHRDATAADYRL